MQRKQSALLAQHNEDGAQQVSSHVEWESTRIRLYHNLASAGHQVTRDPWNAQKILRGGGEAIRIQLNRIRQMAGHAAQSDVDRMQRSVVVLYERQFRKRNFRDKR